MSHLPAWPIWKESPFIRLIVPLIAGIMYQWYLPSPIHFMWLLFALSAVVRWLLHTRPLARQYHGRWVTGVCLHATLFSTGGLVLFYGDIQHLKTSITRQHTAGKIILVTIEEPLSEKIQSFKTIASVEAVLFNHSINKASGKILLYFQKDSTSQQLHYGKQLLLFKALQPVKNTGNPGCFNYQRYCAFQGISHQVYLKRGEYVPLKIENENLFRKFLFSTRTIIAGLLKKYIPGDKEAGLAEAMLIGYKEDLDQRLVQSYSNTGVVHIIAISGLHLGLIYWLLMLLCKPLARYKTGKLVQPILIVAGIWLFSFIAGGAPSVLRSAVMFTCVVIGAQLNRKTSVYNSLAASAFLLLCYDPFWLWDAGFQLSYAAVLSLAMFYKPVYNLLFVSHKFPDLLWKSVSVTLAAQILTVPVSLYHFHQFPNLFLVANLLAVPLSGLIIIGEIILFIAGLFPIIASGVGFLLHHIIYWLNTFIEQVSSLPYATTNNLQINGLQLVCLYVLIGALAWWLLKCQRQGVILSLLALLSFIIIRAVHIWNTGQQKKLIVYNIPRHSAIDVMVGTKYFFMGDSLILHDAPLQKFHLQPCRLLHRVINSFNPGNILVEKNFYRFGKTSFLLLDAPMDLSASSHRIPVDIIILSNNPPIKIAQITGAFQCRHFVFDASNPAWKVARWQQECDQLGITAFSVADKGAFVFNLY